MSIPPISPARKILRFAAFEVDLAAGELRKNGTRIRLQEQPFQILSYLLDRPGEVVTREELRQKLWPADTFVDFDHSLNTAVNKLREALGDSASSPRYVETLARRGYRFLAPVQPAEVKSPAQDSPTMTAGETAVSAATPIAPFHRDLEVPLPRRSLTRALFGLVQAAAGERGFEISMEGGDRGRGRDGTFRVLIVGESCGGDFTRAGCGRKRYPRPSEDFRRRGLETESPSASAACLRLC